MSVDRGLFFLTLAALVAVAALLAATARAPLLFLALLGLAFALALWAVRVALLLHRDRSNRR